jgi:hypothetical protein
MPEDTELPDVLGEELAERAGADVERWLQRPARGAEGGARKQRAAQKAATRIAESLGALGR